MPTDRIQELESQLALTRDELARTKEALDDLLHATENGHVQLPKRRAPAPTAEETAAPAQKAERATSRTTKRPSSAKPRATPQSVEVDTERRAPTTIAQASTPFKEVMRRRSQRLRDKG